jgi:alkylresorcinol/alkylpyrone synthase
LPYPVSLLSLATAVPAHRIHQREAESAARSAFQGRAPDFDRLAPVFASAGIRTRHAIRPLEWYLEPRGWPERTEAYVEGASALFVEAARRALDAAGVAAAEIDTVVTVSSTGIATPSLEARVAGELGLNPAVERVPVFGLGCAGGVSGLSIGWRLARANPGSKVLVVAVELCTASFRLDRLDKANLVATALFGDGAAACILGSGGPEGLATVEGAGQHTWPDTLGIMGWQVDAEGLGVIFDRAIPPFAETRLGPAVGAILDRLGLGADEIARFVCHPGGRKVITALERALDLGQGTLDHEREVLADYGNMSAPTVLFVLERVLAGGLPPRCLLTAMGPGFTASCLSMTAPQC